MSPALAFATAVTASVFELVAVIGFVVALSL